MKLLCHQLLPFLNQTQIYSLTITCEYCDAVKEQCFTKDLSWNEHINNVCSKTNKTLGFLRRNLKISSWEIKETAYKTLVRPIMEYTATVWDPLTQANIDSMEAIQRRAARFILRCYRNTSSVSNMIGELRWPSLQDRR